MDLSFCQKILYVKTPAATWSWEQNIKYNFIMTCGRRWDFGLECDKNDQNGPEI